MKEGLLDAGVFITPEIEVFTAETSAGSGCDIIAEASTRFFFTICWRCEGWRSATVGRSENGSSVGKRKEGREEREGVVVPQNSFLAAG